jgi:hypothetical protein
LADFENIAIFFTKTSGHPAAPAQVPIFFSGFEEPPFISTLASLEDLLFVEVDAFVDVVVVVVVVVLAPTQSLEIEAVDSLHGSLL